MGAILKHELKIYFSSITAYVFGAFLLAFIGFGALLYNIQAAISNFEYVLSFSNIIFAVIIPILTMRVISEERKQKTDQLLYSLPISTTQIILGKYISLLIVFLIPLCIIATYPLIFAKFGDVYLLTSYGSIFAFFMLGAALIALGIFISSLTDNQGLAAGISIAIILLNYFSVSLSEMISSSAFHSLIAICVCIVILTIIIGHLTKNENFALILSAISCFSACGLYIIDQTKFENLFTTIIAKFSLYERFMSFISGVFDITHIVYYITFAIFFLFLSVQSLEKRRYN